LDVPNAPIVHCATSLNERKFFKPVNGLANACSFQLKLPGKFGLRHARRSIKICQSAPLSSGESELFEGGIECASQPPRHPFHQEDEPIGVGQKIRLSFIGSLIRVRYHDPVIAFPIRK
jgi:hypothetical protein